MSPINSLAKDWLPPAILRAIRQRRGGGIRFEGDYATWEEAVAQCTGYDAAPILAKVLDATLKVKRGEAAYERDSVLFDEIEYAWPITAGLMWAAAQSGGRLDVLDFGGALGSSYFQNRAFLAGLPQVRWSVVEQAHYVEAGCQHVQDETLRFYASIDDCLAENKPNVVLLSSALQYLPDPEFVIGELERVGAIVMLIARTPVTQLSGSRLLVQMVPASIYSASYPMWVFAESQLLARLEPHWRVVSRYGEPEGEVRPQTGQPFRFEGWLLEAR